MALLFGLMGTHGSGKTTLAETYAKTHPNVGFARTSVSSVYKTLGLDPKERMTLETRINVQEAILNTLIDEWEVATESDHDVVVTDRTPFDMIGYTMAEVSGYEDISAELSQQIVRYKLSCCLAANAFSGIIHVPIGLPMVEDSTGKVRAASSYIYREHVDMLMKQAAANQLGDVPVRFMIGTDMSSRLIQLHEAIVKAS